MKRKWAIVQQHGDVVRDISIEPLCGPHESFRLKYDRPFRPPLQSNKESLDFVQRHCPFVHTMRVTLKYPSSGLTYSYLESFFTRMSHLRVLLLTIHVDKYSLFMLWSLSNARHLTELCLDIQNSFHCQSQPYTLDEYLAVIDCCSHVLRLTLKSFLLPKGILRGPSHEDWKSRLVRAQELTPATPQKALERALRPTLSPHLSTVDRRSTAPPTRTFTSSSLATKVVVQEAGPRPLYKNSSLIQKLTLDTPGMEEADFLALLSKFPLLEELALVGEKRTRDLSTWTIKSTTWAALAKGCPRLRRLCFRECYLSLPSVSIPDLVTMFPNLQVLVAHPKSLQDPGFQKLVSFDTLDADQDPGIQQTRSERRPQFKHIELVGDLVWPLEVIVHSLIRFPDLESIKVGRHVHVETWNQKPNFESSLYLKPWLCVASLTRLDLHGVVYKDDDQMVWFFRKLQTLEQLSWLVLPIQHLRRAQNILASKRATWEAYGFFRFPRLEKLTITRAYVYLWIYTTDIKYIEAAFVVEAAPLLRSLLLLIAPEGDCCDRLKSTFPRLLVTTFNASPKDKVAWT